MTLYSTPPGPHFYRSGHRSVHRAAVAAAIGAALATLATAALAQAQTQTQTLPQNRGPVEEVLITGSFIKSTGEDEASPVEVLDNAYIENTGAVNIIELTSRLAVNSGSENNPDALHGG